jgi:hypothetical protein
MQRSVSQLLFSYTPGKAVDWESGTAIVQLTHVRLASAWDPARAQIVLDEVAAYLRRWRDQEGRVHPNFPEPRRDDGRLDGGRFTVGEPRSIEADLLETALQCLSCSRLVFARPADLARRDGDTNPYRCPDPSCNGTLRQFPQVFVHGCGHLETLQKWMPTMKWENGRLATTKYPLECKSCGAQGVPMIANARSERAKDLIVVCKRCKSEISDGRVTARCPECVRLLSRGELPTATRRQDDGAPDVVSAPDADVENEDHDTDDRQYATAVSRVLMRVTSYRASEAYYPHSITTLRLDRPALHVVADEELERLRQLVPEAQEEHRPADRQALLDHLFAQARSAAARDDTAEVEAIMAQVQAVMRGEELPQHLPGVVEPLESPPVDLVQAIRESRALRTQVRMRSYTQVLEAARRGATAALMEDLEQRHATLGLRPTLLVDDLPVVTATFGFTRRSFEPVYEEYDRSVLPTQLQPFYVLDHYAATQVANANAEGTVPILAREGEHEGLFFGLEPERVLRWLARNGITLPDDGRVPIARILGACEEMGQDRYYDHIQDKPVRRLVFGLVHSLSHAALRLVSRSAGLERTSVSEYIFLPLLGTVVYANNSSFRMGCMETLLRSDFYEFLEGLSDHALTCLFDPVCLDHSGACAGCLHSPEICCRVFNHGLSRAFLMGGHTPWEDASVPTKITGYWEV